MAHIYSRIGKDDKTLGEIAELFRIMLGGDNPTEAINWFGFIDADDYTEFQDETVGQLWQSIDKILIRKEDNNYYVFNGLDNNGLPATDGINALSDSDYINAELRIAGMNNRDRSGDIILIMKDITSEPVNDHYTSGVACKSWHGSLNPSDSYVPFIIAYPGGNKTEIEPHIDNTPGCSINGKCEGNWKATDIIKEFIKGQYQ